MTRTSETCARKTTRLATRSLSLLLIAVLFGSGNMLIAQKKIARQQFSQMSVLTRASYFEDEILKAANAEGVDPNILWTIAYLETRFRPWLTSPKNAKGMMQFIPTTAERFNLSDPYEPISAIRAAAKYVKYLSKQFGGRVDSILAAYNAGEGTVSAYLYGKSLRNGQKTINPNATKTVGGIPPYRETTGYVRHGLTIYRWLTDRRVFPTTIVSANRPTVSSVAVANFNAYDREFGNVIDFNDLNVQSSANGNHVAVSKKEFLLENIKVGEQIRNRSSFTEVYYDAHSGNRYLIDNKNKKQLSEIGVVVISTNTRRETANQARSTLVAVPTEKQN